MLKVLMVFVCLLAIGYCASPPAPTPVDYPAAPTVFTLLKVLGAVDLNTRGPNSAGGATASGISSISRIATIAGGILPNSNFSQGGLIATDIGYYRAVYYANPIPATGGAGRIVFAQPDFTTSDQTILTYGTSGANFIGVSHSAGQFLFSDQNRAYLYSGSSGFPGNSASYPPAANNPSVVVGSCSNCSYAAVSSSTASTSDATYFYMSVSGCSYILVWRISSLTNNYAEPAYVLGQSSVASCGISACNTNTPVTCLTAYAMDTDCYGGLWVFDRQSNSILYFPSGERVATFALNYTSIPTSIALGTGNRCNFMAISASQGYQYIVQITYNANNRPTGATAFTSFGNSAANPGVGPQTSSIGPVTGLAWDESSPDYLWVSDQVNNRLVYFTPFGTSAASQSLVPSNTPSASISASTSTSLSRTQSISTSNSRTPSVSLTPSVTPTIGLTPTASAFPTPTPSANPQFGNSTFTASAEASFTTGQASLLSSWVSLLLF